MKILYISDLDGTLLNSNAELSQKTAGIINELIENGIDFSFATARTSATTLKMFERVKLNRPVILMNGVKIYNPSAKRFIRTEYLSEKTAGEIVSASEESGISGLMYCLNNGNLTTYYEKLESRAISDFVAERKLKYNKVFIQADSFAEFTDGVIYFCFLDKLDKIERLQSHICGIEKINIAKYRDNYSDDLWYLEIFSENASKFHAIEFLRREYGYDKIVGFGDNLNDIPLFEACDECYAVDNAVPELKAKATGVIGSNDSDGVALWLIENSFR